MYRRLLMIVLTTLLPTLTLAEDAFSPPTQEVVLTIRTNEVEIALDLPALRNLEVSEFTTTTIWTEGEQTFRGTRMTHLLDRLGVTAGTVTLTAVNDYQVTIPVADFSDDGAIVAYERNGKTMSLRDKGPLWLVYPYDADARFRSEIIYANSIWQLDRITIEE